MPFALCYINNRFQPYTETSLHISDLGLQRGFAIFDYFLEMDGRIPFFDDYLDRFYTSAESLNLEVPLSRELLKEKVSYLLQQNNFGRSGIKLLLTGGFSDDLYAPSAPNFIVLNMPLKHNPCEFGEGVKLMLSEYQRFQPEVKTTFYLPSLIHYQKMIEQGAIELLYHQNGLISETTRANIFLIRKNTLITPGNGILRGITRKHVLLVAEKLMKVEIRNVAVEELWRSEEVFITGTSKHVMPVVKIDDTVIGDGKPGSITKSVSEAFEKYYSI